MKTFDISKGKTTETGELTGPEYDYLEGTQSMIIGGRLCVASALAA